MKKIINTLAVSSVFVLFCFPSLTNAQMSTGKLGLTTNGTGLAVAYGVSDNIRANLGLNVNISSNTTFGFSGSAWLYSSSMNNLTPYLGGGFSFYSGTFTNSFSLNAVYGAEYWLSNNFSVNANAGTSMGFNPFALGFYSEGGFSWWF